MSKIWILRNLIKNDNQLTMVLNQLRRANEMLLAFGDKL